MTPVYPGNWYVFPFLQISSLSLEVFLVFFMQFLHNFFNVSEFIIITILNIFIPYLLTTFSLHVWRLFMLISSLSAILLNPLISCGAFSVESFGLSSYILISSATRDIFLLFPLMFYVMADVMLFGFFFFFY